MDEDPMRNRCLEPQSLVMTRSECFYCFGEEGVKCYTISNNYGIKSCNQHFASSVRDCKAFMYRNGFVRINDIYKMEQFAPFFDYLKDGFSVKRASGLIEPGWSLNLGYGCAKELIKYDESVGKWIIPVMKDDHDLIKRIYVDDFLIPEILLTLKDGFKEKLQEFLVMLKNVYKEESERYDTLVDNNKPTKVSDKEAGIVQSALIDGVVARVLIMPT